MFETEYGSARLIYVLHEYDENLNVLKLTMQLGCEKVPSTAYNRVNGNGRMKHCTNMAVKTNNINLLSSNIQTIQGEQEHDSLTVTNVNVSEI